MTKDHDESAGQKVKEAIDEGAHRTGVAEREAGIGTDAGKAGKAGDAAKASPGEKPKQ